MEIRRKTSRSNNSLTITPKTGDRSAAAAAAEINANRYEQKTTAEEAAAREAALNSYLASNEVDPKLAYERDRHAAVAKTAQLAAEDWRQRSEEARRREAANYYSTLGDPRLEQGNKQERLAENPYMRVRRLEDVVQGFRDKAGAGEALTKDEYSRLKEAKGNLKEAQEDLRRSRLSETDRQIEDLEKRIAQLKKDGKVENDNGQGLRYRWQDSIDEYQRQLDELRGYGSGPLATRIGQTAAGAAETYAGSMVGAGATLARAGDAVDTRAMEETIRSAQTMIRDLTVQWKQTTDYNEKRRLAAQISTFQKTLDDTTRQLEEYRSGNRMGEAWTNISDRLNQKGLENITKAKADTGKVGGLLVDAAVGAMQMGLDLVASGGISPMAAMAVRSFGNGAEEARQKGYNEGQQIALGVASAAVEYFSEKLFGGNPVYDEDVGLINQGVAALIKFLGEDPAGSRVLKALASAPAEKLYEGLEEMVSDWLNPMAEYLITGKYEPATMEEILKSGAVGVLTALVAEGGQQILTRRGGPRNALPQSALDQLRALAEQVRPDEANLAQTTAEAPQNVPAPTVEAAAQAEENVASEATNTAARTIDDMQERIAQTKRAENVESAEDIRAAANMDFRAKGREAAVEQYDGSTTPSAYYRAFTAFYRAGVNGADIDSVPVNNATELSESQRNAAYEAGKTDAAVSLAEEKAKAKGVDVEMAQQAFADAESEQWALDHFDAETVNDMTRLARGLGNVLRFADEVWTESGAPANANIRGRVITLEKNNPNPVMTILGHELTHRMQALAPEAYRDFRNYVSQYLGAEVDEMQKLYRSKGVNVDYEQALDEAAANFGGRLIHDSAALDSFIRENKDNRNLLQKVADFLHELWQRLTGQYAATAQMKAEIARETAFMREAEQKLRAALEAAEQQATENRENKTAPAESESETQYSIKEIVGDSGKNYGIGVYLDSTLLEGLTETERVQMMAERINELGGSTFVAYDQNGDPVEISIAEKGRKFRNQSGKKVPVNEDLTRKYRKSHIKQESVVLADELIQAAKYKESNPSRYSHGWLDDNGSNPWDKWTVYVQEKNNSVWEAVLHIANTEDGEKILYDIDPIEMVEQSGNSDTSTTKDIKTQEGESVKREEAAREVGVHIDEKSESANPTLYSLKTWNESDYVTQRDEAAKEMAKALGISQKKAKAYIDSVNSIAKIIADDRTRLDYEASPGRSSFVSNAEYGGSVDFSTVCKKRRLLTGTMSAIQNALRNTALSVDEVLQIRQMMKDRGYEVSCGLCYVEGSRAKMGEFAQAFIELYKKHNPDAKWIPDMYDVNTPDGAEQMRIQHPDVYKQYEYFWNHYGTLKKGDPNLFASQQKPKLFQQATEYNGEILNKFRKASNVEEKNRNGGLRLQSFSDFEIIHLLDNMQVITDMARVGLAGQAYTKVPDFAWALGDTGLKINLSLIAKGVDADGHVILDEVEGMPRADAEALRNRYSDNVGTILVVFNDAQLKAAMADDFVDFIIPFHKSQWSAKLYDAIGLPKGTQDYTDYQNEKLIRQTYHEYQGRMVKDKATNYMPNTYWDFSKSGKENAETYLRMCAENNKVPKFYNLLVDNGDGSYSLQPDGSTDGYWKLLIDFKMYNNEGVGVPQRPVTPDFNMEEAERMLRDYRGGHQNYPVAQDVVDDFLKGRQETRNSLKSDADYMAAVEAGDMDTAQKMVDEAAIAAGAMTLRGGKRKPYYHGSTAKFTVFDINRAKDGTYGYGYYFSPMKSKASDYGETMTVFLMTENVATRENHKVTAEQIRNIADRFGLSMDSAEISEWINSLDDVSILTRLQKRITSYTEATPAEFLPVFREVFGYDGLRSGNETVLWDNKLIKSADPVTYDDNGNVIPLSERFNPEEQDIRYSLKGTENVREIVRLRQQNERLRERVEYWKGQTKLTKEPWRVDSKAVEKATRTLAKDVGAKLTAEETKALAKDMEGLYNLLASQDDLNTEEVWAEARHRADKIADTIVENAVTVNDALYREYEELRKYLRNTYLTLSEADAHNIPDFADWRKRQFGRMNVRADFKTNVNQVYRELQERWPEWFSEEREAHPADQVLRIAEVLDELYTIEEYNPYSADLAGAKANVAADVLEGFFDAPQVAKTFADRAEERVEAERREGQRRVREAIERERQLRDEQIKRLKEHQQDIQKRAAERRSDSQDRQRLLNVAKRLQRLKTTAANRAMIDNLIGDLDTVSVNLTGQTLKKLEDLRDWYWDRQANDPDFLKDPHIEKMLQRLSKRQISTLTPDEVLDLTDVLLNIENQLRTERKLIDSEDRRDTYLMGEEVIRDVNNTRGSKEGFLDTHVVAETLSPLRYIRRLTGYADNDPLYKLTNALADGQRKAMDYQMRAERAFASFARDKAFNRFFAGDKAEEITITGQTADGPVEVKITPAMRTSLYLHSLNDQNLKHIAEGGITIPDIKLYKKGELAKAYSNGVTVKLSPTDVQSITSKMTANEKAFAKAAYNYFNGQSRNEINEVSEKLKGYSIARVGNYYPIETNKNFLNAEYDTLKFDGTIEGMGFLKERQNSSRPVMLRDANDVLQKSIQNHAKYVGLAIPVRNMGKVMSMTEQGYEGAVKDAIARKWGDTANSYIQKLMTDLQNGGKASDTWAKDFGKLRSNYARAVLTNNLSVAMKQAASYPTAAAVLGWKPLLQAMGSFGKVNQETIAKYTPLQWYRSQGFSTKELGDLKANNKKLPAILNWVQGVDLLTTRKLWKASEYYVRNNNKALNVGSDAYYKAVADVYNRVIEETQPNYTTMQRPQLLRSEDTLMQNLAMFKTQPFQNFNILYDAAANLEAKMRQGDKTAIKEARQNLGRAVSSQVAQMAVFAAITMLWSMLRGRDDKYKDEDGETTFGSVMSALGKDMVGGLLAGVPFGSDLWEFASSKLFGDRYYGLDVVTVTALTDTINSVNGMSELIHDIVSTLVDGGDVDWNSSRIKADGYLDDISKAMGIQYENVTNLFNAVARGVLIKAEGKYLGAYHAMKLTEDPEKKSAQYYNALYDAYVNDQEAYKEIYGDMVEGSFTAEKIKNAMEARMKEAAGVKSVNELETRWVPPEYQEGYQKAVEDITSSEEYQAADEKEQAKMVKGAYTEVTDQQKADKIQETAESDQSDDEKLAAMLDIVDSSVDEMIDTAIRDGYSVDQVADMLRDGTLGSYIRWKDSTAKMMGVSLDQYTEYRAATEDMHSDKDANGKGINGSKKAKVLAYIDSLPLSVSQKDALYYDQNYAASTILDAPWH